ncbi:DUF724 domain-containing protein 6 [Cajanus cajan]|uniref:Agenet domain-containing protein n=1 Tax=Cajanus cajan TaxID=3821 RepID=A0A151RTL9_CAJCA|nr:DUF724 domain-containing protein 6 [Cajanus cajan]KYP45875.1 hypothetical protein KK1_032554 [Cajanus cajan]
MRPPRKKVDFLGGDKVEVCSNEDGFLGSYYAATVLSRLDNGLYVVRYDTLLQDDESQPLSETLFPKELRPAPPPLPAKDFSLYQRVDAFDNDGWWLGQITGRCDHSKYYVYFVTTNEEIAYPASRIRVHQEWLNGEWVLSD